MLAQLRPFKLPFVLFAIVIALLGSACGDPKSAVDRRAEVATEPTKVVFHPETGKVAVDIVNTGSNPLTVSDFRVEGPDWSAFSLAKPVDPTELQPQGRLRIELVADAAALRGPAPEVEGERGLGSVVEHDPEPIAEIGKDEYREGQALLRFAAGNREQKVPIRFEDPSWVWLFLIPALVKIHLLVLAFIMPVASLLTWMERKQSAMVQDRIGPNMARITIGGLTLRLWGLLHIATDGLKMLFKEDFVPRRAHRALYTLAPVFAFVPAIAVFAIVPFGDALCYGSAFDVLSQADVDQCAQGRGGTPLQVAKIDVGLLFYFAVASIASYGTTLAGWSSYNKWAILGSLRASAQMISYEVAIGLTIVGALLVYGTLEPHELVHAQLQSHWGIVLQPLAFVLFLTAAIAETKRAPFDIPEGESEIIGYFIEYSGMRFGLFYLGEFIEVVFVSALVTTLFLGGWALPFGMMTASGFASPLACQMFFTGAGLVIGLTGVAIWRASKHAETVGAILALVGVTHLSVAVYSAFTGWGTALPHIVVVVVQMLTWGVKILLLCWLQLLIRWTLPRFRYDQLMALGWKGLLPLSIANIIATAVVVYATMGAPKPPAADPGDTVRPAGQLPAQAGGSPQTAEQPGAKP